MTEMNVKTIELYNEEGLLVGSYEVRTKPDMQKVLLAIADVAMSGDTIKFK